MKDAGIVNIHGREYTTVAARVQKFREEHGLEYGITTEIISADNERVVMKACIRELGSDEGNIATGHAEESRSSSQINRTSALENCETSAIGRALAAFGMAGTEFASADEVANAIDQQGRSQTTPAPKPPSKPNNEKSITLAQAGMLLGIAKQKSGLVERQDALDFFKDETGVDLKDVKQGDIERIKAVFGADEEVSI